MKYEPKFQYAIELLEKHKEELRYQIERVEKELKGLKELHSPNEIIAKESLLPSKIAQLESDIHLFGPKLQKKIKERIEFLKDYRANCVYANTNCANDLCDECSEYKKFSDKNIPEGFKYTYDEIEECLDHEFYNTLYTRMDAVRRYVNGEVVKFKKQLPDKSISTDISEKIPSVNIKEIKSKKGTNTSTKWDRYIMQSLLELKRVSNIDQIVKMINHLFMEKDTVSLRTTLMTSLGRRVKNGIISKHKVDNKTYYGLNEWYVGDEPKRDFDILTK